MIICITVYKLGVELQIKPSAVVVRHININKNNKNVHHTPTANSTLIQINKEENNAKQNIV